MYIKVTVVSESREEKVIQTAEDSFTVRVQEKPKRGMANRKVCALLTTQFGNKNRLRIISGYQSPHKIIVVDPVRSPI